MRPVTVLAVPEKVAAAEEKNFLRTLLQKIQGDRPRIVLDCSPLLDMNKSAMRLLLSSLEEAMKRNGDVRLAALNHSALTALTLTGISRLFEIFPTPAEAVHSYRRRSPVVSPQVAEVAILAEAEKAA
jgi:anti-sigma B factor antagonist